MGAKWSDAVLPSFSTPGQIFLGVIIMPSVLKASLSYFAVVFAAAFVIGTLRVTVIAPRTGALVAVAFEVPLLLALSWVVAGRVLRRWPLDGQRRAAMGAIAFALLLLAELALATLLFGQTAATFLASTATAPGALGLAGQIGFALIPALRRHPTG
jgi:hypothetical protein